VEASRLPTARETHARRSSTTAERDAERPRATARSRPSNRAAPDDAIAPAPDDANIPRGEGRIDTPRRACAGSGGVRVRAARGHSRRARRRRRATRGEPRSDARALARVLCAARARAQCNPRRGESILPACTARRGHLVARSALKRVTCRRLLRLRFGIVTLFARAKGAFFFLVTDSTHRSGVSDSFRSRAFSLETVTIPRSVSRNHCAVITSGTFLLACPRAAIFLTLRATVKKG